MNPLDVLTKEDRVDVRYSLFELLVDKSSRVDSAVRYLKKATYIDKDVLIAILCDDEEAETTNNNEEEK